MSTSEEVEKIDVSRYQETFDKLDTELGDYSLKMSDSRKRLIELNERKKTLRETYQKQLLARMSTIEALKTSYDEIIRTKKLGTAKVGIQKIPVVGRVASYVAKKLGYSDAFTLTLSELSNIHMKALEDLNKDYTEIIRNAQTVAGDSEAYVNSLFERRKHATGLRTDLEQKTGIVEKYMEKLKSQIQEASPEQTIDLEKQLFDKEKILEELYFQKSRCDMTIKRCYELVQDEKEVFRKAFTLTLQEARKTQLSIKDAYNDLKNLFSKLQEMAKLAEASEEGIIIYAEGREYHNKVAGLVTELTKVIAVERDKVLGEKYIAPETIDKMKKDINELEAHIKASTQKREEEVQKILEGKKGKEKEKFEKLEV